ncbi:hypothetical protein XENTR_v10013018 [Xenopus tropicalis]|nr:hypothetical protein XENTR_v10013018 [Xenopus tropicalis]
MSLIPMPRGVTKAAGLTFLCPIRQINAIGLPAASPICPPHVTPMKPVALLLANVLRLRSSNPLYCATVTSHCVSRRPGTVY